MNERGDWGRGCMADYRIGRSRAEPAILKICAISVGVRLWTGRYWWGKVDFDNPILEVNEGGLPA